MMNFFEKRQIQKYIDKWVGTLDSETKGKWNEWLKKRDIIAKELGLNEEQILNVTKLQITSVVLYTRKKKINLTEATREQIVTTKGTTKELELLAGLANTEKEYEAKCSEFLAKFDKRYDQLRNGTNNKPAKR